jgi:protein-S-isoprenylcysteine O-methyltransferase Ste14
MQVEPIFRGVLFASGVAMFAIRIYHQRKVHGQTGTLLPEEPQRGLLFGGLAALCTIGFGAAYIVKPGWPAWAFALPFPAALRGLGVLLLAGGLGLLFLAHHYLALNFSSFVRVRDEHTLVEDGPYRWIRHPIYTAYMMSYVGGGLVSGNWVLTLVATLLFATMVALRVGGEEEAMLGEFGARYEAYMQRTGRFLPRWGGGAHRKDDVA